MIKLAVAALACLIVGVLGIWVAGQEAQPPDYVKTSTCPTEDSCDWLFTGFHYEWVPVVP